MISSALKTSLSEFTNCASCTAGVKILCYGMNIQSIKRVNSTRKGGEIVSGRDKMHVNGNIQDS